MSPKSTSLIPPSDATCEKPILRAVAQSSTAVASAPDWVTKARSPTGGVKCAKLALRPAAGEMRPRQFGPTMRKRCGRAAASIFSLQRLALSPLALPEAGGYDDGGATAPGAELRDEAGHARRRGGDHREVRGDRKLGDRAIVDDRMDGLLMRVDRHDRAAEPGLEEVACEHGADRVRVIARPDECDRLRSEERVEIACRHAPGLTPSHVCRHDAAGLHAGLPSIAAGDSKK